MNISNYYWHFPAALTPKFCDDLIAYANSQEEVMARTGGYGDVDMPKDWDIDRDKLSGDILQSVIQNKDFPFSRTWDMLNTYMRDHVNLEYNFNLINKETWGNIYKPSETL